MIHSIYSLQLGKSRFNVAMIKFYLQRNQKLLICTSNPVKRMNELRKDFPTALFIIVGNLGIEIKIRDKKELEL